MISLDDNQIKSDQKTITTEIDKKEVLIKDKENNTDIRILENKKSKSNFIWTKFLKIVLSIKLWLFFGIVRCFNQVDF